MIDTIVSCKDHFVKITGPARSGKTEALIRRCAALLNNGVDPSTIVVEVSSAFAAQSFHQRLESAIDPKHSADIERISIMRALDICVETLGTADAQTATGRTPRLLNAAEYSFFLEDMKTLGLPQRKLRTILNRLYSCWSALTPEEKWLNAEEKPVWQHAMRILHTRGAMLEQEAPMICAQYLKSDAGAGARQRYDYVLCDDFQNLTHAEQSCLRLLAGKQIMVAGNPNEATTICSTNPNPDGLAAFDTHSENVAVFTLSVAYGNPQITALTNALCKNPDMDASLIAETSVGTDIELQTIKWNTPEDEIAGLAKYLHATLKKSDTPRNQICIVVPNKRWGLLFERALKKRGLSVCASAVRAGLGGDPRDVERAKSLIAYTKLNLLADPYDMTAWRSWCGFGDARTRSDAWSNLQKYAEELGLSLYETLEGISTLNEEPFPHAKALAEAFTQGCAFIEKNARRKGFTLMHTIGVEELPEFEDIAQLLVGDEDAASLYSLARNYISNPSWSDDTRALHISTFVNTCGTDYDTVIFASAVDGFMPSYAAFEKESTEELRERAINQDRRLFYTTVSKARERVIFSVFSKAELQLAERTKMHVVRKKVEDGTPMAILRPSTFLDEAGDARPSTIGGQGLLSECALN